VKTLVAKKQMHAGLARFTTALEGFERVAKQTAQNDDISFGVAESFSGTGAAHAALAKESALTQTSECQLAVASYDKSLNILSDMQRRGALVAQDQSVFHQALDGRTACQKILATRGRYHRMPASRSSAPLEGATGVTVSTNEFAYWKLIQDLRYVNIADLDPPRPGPRHGHLYG
jgi:hypothetical protein